MGMTTAGYSGTPLAKKLGLKDGQKIRLVNAPDHYRTLFDAWPRAILEIADKAAIKDFIHYFTRYAAMFRGDLPALKKELAPAGILWISWPKKSAKVATDVTENVIRDAALAIGLVDVKVCAVDETWSGLKLVIPVKDRAQSSRAKRRDPDSGIATKP
jgi:2-methylisocitrate lyase-like PEP mutase family enzyme